MDLSNARSMEIYGRLGLADKVRNAGWPLDAKLDVYVGPNIVDRPYKVLHYPSILDMQAKIDGCSDGSMPREPYERIAQYNIEALFKGEAEAQDNITVLYGHELTSFEDHPEGIRATARTTDGNNVIISADYLVGCDGGNSLVRRQLGIQLDGQSAVARMYMIFFRCDDLLQKTGLRAFRHYYIAGKRQGALLAQDDLKRWALHVQIKPDTDVSKFDPLVEIRDSWGSILISRSSTRSWTPHLVVADRYSQGRVFMAGDAVHQYIPTGGLGINTGVPEADNLSWKLAAVLKGWGGPRLLSDSYHHIERIRSPSGTVSRRRSTLRVAIWRSQFDPVVLEKSEKGSEQRKRLANAIDLYQRRSHEQTGITRYRYTNSPICFLEDGPLPDPEGRIYHPDGHPGARLPHAWLNHGLSIHDRIGFAMTLLTLDADPSLVEAFEAAAREAKIPLDILEVGNRPDLLNLYGAQALLVRPDLHVAWRGDVADSPRSILSVSTGHGS